jgi:hypothetical protein
LEAIEREAKNRLAEQNHDLTKNSEYYQRNAHSMTEPIFIASTVGTGTNFVRANHLDAALYYFQEQKNLKASGAPIK